MGRLRIFISSPSDVPAERLRAGLVIDRLSQDYSRFFAIESYRWEYEALLAQKHFQDAIEPPSRFDIVVLVLWSRLGTLLPEKTELREYRGIDNRAPVTGTEWEYEEALKSARETGAPDLLAFRKLAPTEIDPTDVEAQAKSIAQLNALNDFWQRHFVDRGVFRAAFVQFRTLEEFAGQLENSLRRLIELRIQAAAKPDATAPVIWFGDPFRGLEPYEFQHAAIFFGRNALVIKASEQLATNAGRGVAFLLVSGPSGSGKSSLVKAAVVPSLMKPQRIGGLAFLRRLVFRPADGGGDLILGIARALTQANASAGIGLEELLGPGQDVADLAAELRRRADDPGFIFKNALGHITQAAREKGIILPIEEGKLILVIDQLEEIFTTPGVDPPERTIFLKLLRGLASSRAVWVIATLRSDYWHLATDVDQVTDAGASEMISLSANLGRLDIAAPSPMELAEMIRRPAQAAGLSFEVHAMTGHSLDSVIAEDAAAAPGVLPLLSFTLNELYQDMRHRGTNELTYAGYEALGGLKGAIATRADKVIDELPEVAQLALPRVLRALTTVANPSDKLPVARSVPRASFAEGTPARRVVDGLMDARLLVATNDDGAVVRLAHEALISHWKRARDQLERDRRDLEVRSVVEAQFERWQRSTGSDRNRLLLRDPDLANAADLARRWGDELPPFIRSFIRRSKRHSQLRQTLTAAAAVLFAMVSAAAILAAIQIERARKEIQVSLALANSHSELRENHLRAALDYAVQAYDAKPSEDTRSAVLAGLMQISPYLVTHVEVGAAFPDALAWSDEDVLAFATSQSSLNFFRVSGGNFIRSETLAQELVRSNDGPQPAIVAMRNIAPNRLIAVFQNGSVASMDIGTGATRVWRPDNPIDVKPLLDGASVSPDGTLVVVVPTDGAPRLLVCMQDRIPPACTERILGSAFANAIAINPRGDRIALDDDNGHVLIVTSSGEAVGAPLYTGGPVRSLAWNPQGDRLAVGAQSGGLTVFDMLSGKELARFPSGVSPGFSTWLRWDPVGRRLSYVCDFGVICISSFESDGTMAPNVIRLIGHSGSVTRLTWSTDGMHLASADDRREIIVWSVVPDRNVAFDLQATSAAAVSSIGYAPISNRLAATLTDGNTSIWDMADALASDRGPLRNETRMLSGASTAPSSATWGADGTFAVGYEDARLALWPPDLNGPARIRSLPATPARLAVANNGTSVAMIALDGRAFLAEAAKSSAGATVRLVEPPASGPARALAMHPKQDLLFASFDGGLIAAWDLSTRKIVMTLPIVDPVAPLGLSISPDGRFLAATGGDIFVKVFDLTAPADRFPTRLPLKLEAQTQETAGIVTFSPDGALIAAIGSDDRIYIWQVRKDGFEPFVVIGAQLDTVGARKTLHEYDSGLAWIGSRAIAVLSGGAIRIINLDIAQWRQRLGGLYKNPPPSARSSVR